MTRVAAPPAGVVLAGGASVRMGTDKAFVEIDGTPMALRVAAALRAAGCDPVTCQGGDPERLGGLGLAVHADDEPGRAGPVRAIASALSAIARSTAASTVVIAACDLPDLTAEVVGSLLRASVDHDAVAVASAGGRRHLVSAWPVAARVAVEDAIGRGIRPYGDLLAELDAAGTPVVDVAVDAGTVRNVNRPEQVPGGTSGWRYPQSPMTPPEISVDELAPLLERGARLVDVREPDEFETARVPGAILVPLATVPDHVDAFRGEGTTYVICRSGARSMRACEFLAEHGIDVANVAGGTLAWIDAGRDVMAGPT